MASGGRLERGKFLSVDADGSPPVIHRARMMVREASGRASVNLGGIAEAVAAFVPEGGQKPFFLSAGSICRPKLKKRRRSP